MSDDEADGEALEMLFEAVEENEEEAVEEAIEEGADVEGLNEDGYTPLIFGAELGSDAACEVLLVNDASPNAQMEENGYTALHAAAAAGQSGIVEMLLESEADPSVKDNDGKTALQVAQDAGETECEEMLADAAGDEDGDGGDGGDGGDDAGAAAGDDGFSGGGFGDDAGFGGGGFGGDGNSVTLIAVPGAGWGLTLVGPSAGDGRHGVYVSKVKDGSPAATEGTLKPGCKITTIDGEMLDMAMTRKDAIGLIKMAGEQLQLGFEQDDEGFKQYEQAKAGPVKNEFSGPVHAVELGMTVGGVGVIMAGPANPKEFQKGVFVKACADLSSAYASGKICTGQRILAINGKSVAGLVLGAVNKMAMQPMNNMVVFQLQYDPIGFGAYDGGRELNRRKSQGPPEQEAGSMVVGGGSGSDALRMMPSDKWFFGKVPKAIIVEALIQQGPGTFALRTMPKNPEGAVVLMINDNANVVSFVITFESDGSCTFARKKHSDIDSVIELVQGSPMTSKHGGEPFVATYPLKGGLEFNFYAFSQGQMPTPAIGGPRQPPQQQQQRQGQQQQQQQQRPPQISQKASMKAAKASAKAASKERKRSIKVAKKQEKAAKKAGQEYDATADSWVAPTYPVERLAIAKRDAPTFGMTFIGPEPGKDVSGVYITKIKEGGPTEQQSDGKVKRGCKILMMNGLSMATAMKSEATGSLKGAVTAVITYQYDPAGFAQYDGGALINSIREEAIGAAPKLEDFGESGFGDDF